MTSIADGDGSSREQSLAQDVASLSRVRNRLARAPDEQLPKILPALLPRLLLRLEQYSESTIDDPQCQKTRLQALEDVSGILVHALERVRGANSDVQVGDLMNSMFPFVKSRSPVSSTWALVFLQSSMKRCTVGSMPPLTMSTMIQSVDFLYNDLLLQTKMSTQTRLTNASWLLLDCIIMSAGLKPLVDWDMESFENKEMSWETQKSESWDALAPHEAIDTTNLDGNGTFHFLLDLLLFWPTEPFPRSGISEFGTSRISHRSLISGEEHNVQARRTTGRRAGRWASSKWNDSTLLYLRHLKLNCLRCAVWPADHGLFQGRNAGRALILSILMASCNSMHGRLAADFVNHHDTSKGFKKIKNAFEVSSLGCSLQLACALLILVVGDRSAQPILAAFEAKHGPKLWESILGHRPSEKSLQRPPLPLVIAGRAVDFLLHHSLKWASTEHESKDDTRLLIDLALILASRPKDDQAILNTDDSKHGKFWGVQLVKSFYNQLIASFIIHNEDTDDWTINVFEKCLDASREVLQVVVEVGESNVENQRNPHPQMPLGVPAPFLHRQDLNQLLNCHRTAQKRQKLGMDDAIKAREAAYEFISALAAYTIGRQEKSFELTIFLLECAVYEDECMQHYVTKALEALLEVYSDALGTDVWWKMLEQNQFALNASMQQQAIPLLPALLDAVCSDSITARRAASKWIKTLLQRLDSQAARYLALYLVNDIDAGVSRMARDVLDQEHQSVEEEVSKDESVLFLDITSHDGIIYMENELKTRIQALSRRLEIPLELAGALLYDFNFSIEDAQTAYESDRQATRDRCGLIIKPDVTINMSDSTCGICYENIEETEALSMECGHDFCRDCWVSFFEAASEECAISFLNTRCPQHGCNTRVLSHHIQMIVPDLYPKWTKAFLNSFIELDPSYRFCPGPDCRFVGVLPVVKGQQRTTCDHCNTSFCFHCAEAPHEPATCEDNVQWNKLTGSSNFWIKKNAKLCPGCKAPIEKNMGCNHMTCEKCKTQFCWLCLTKLRAHSENHACNRYDQAANAEDDVERRALFLADRYQAHDVAEQFAHDQYKRFHENPEKLVQAFWFLAEEEEEVLHDSLKTVVEARVFLKNSYVASFGLRNDPTQLGILESHQAALEMFTERLSQLVETNLHRLYLEKGEIGMKTHFRGLAFYRASVVNYTERFLAVVSHRARDSKRGISADAKEIIQNMHHRNCGVSE